MESTPPELTLLYWFGQIDTALILWMNMYWWPVWAGLIFIACLIGMAPLATHHTQPFVQLVWVWLRKMILWAGVILMVLPLVSLYLYDLTMQHRLGNSQPIWLSWFIDLAQQKWPLILAAAVCGWALRFMFKRYALPAWSGLLRQHRNPQTQEMLSDIRDETRRFKAKSFVPSKYYRKEAMVIGLDEKHQPIAIPIDTWHETNMQVIGPTRYGKGIILGTLMDQAIRQGDGVFYIDPKKDPFAPQVMYQACRAAGRRFYYLTLHDEGIGQWAPFAGGTERDALARLEIAFGLELTGDPGTDYYKSQELKEVHHAFQQTRSLKGLKGFLEKTDANRINAELARWSSLESLCAKRGSGFSIAKALKENAVVYVQGGLDDSVLKMATKLFIIEMIQEARRLEKARGAHLTAVIDEVSFLTSKTLAQALATTVGSRVNFVLAYQSQNDLFNIDDKTVDPKYVYQSINVNSQIKAVYGGADYETAEWAANLSGTIVKEVTQLEKTEVSGAGGETWENKRFVGKHQENTIHTNVVLTLPPRVCVFVQPRQLASICFTAFVPVKDGKALEDYLIAKAPVRSAPSPAKDGNERFENTETNAYPEAFLPTDDSPKIPGPPPDTGDNTVKSEESLIRLGDGKDVNTLDGKATEIQALMDKKVSKASIARIMGVSRTALYHFMRDRNLG